MSDSGLGQKLKDLRKLKGVSQVMLSKLSGVSVYHIRGVENGMDIYVHLFIALVKVLGGRLIVVDSLNRKRMSLGDLSDENH